MSCYCPFCQANFYRPNPDEELRELERVWRSQPNWESSSRFKAAIERVGEMPPPAICASCNAECSPETGCGCGAVVCNNCRGEEDGHSVCKMCAQECSCGTEIGGGEGTLCDNCKEYRCEECALVCQGCEHNHVLCIDDCNEDEFMRQCDECLQYFCTQCSDNCFEEHTEDCYY